MKRTILLIGVAFILATAPSYAQDAPSGFGARIGFTNFQYPFTEKWKWAEARPSLELEYIHSLNNVLSLGIPFRFGQGYFPTDNSGGFRSESMTSLDATLQLKYFRSRALLYPYLYGGLGAVAENFKDVYFSAPLGLGLNIRLADNAYLSTKAEYRIAFQDFRNALMLGAGVLINFGNTTPIPAPISDRDRDGIPDAQDRCPDVPGLAIFQGCPDTDGDGIPDKEDRCPDQAGPASNQGCPITDRDGDGIADAADDCPDQAGPASTRGCPDRDGDGIADKDDDCPDQRGPAALKGCPDRDNDGIADKNDKCPDTPGPVSNNGCPVITQEDRAVLDLAVKNVQFETGKASLLQSSFNVLDQVAELMRKYPDYKLRIGGHTDSIGEAPANQKLSESRAQTCYDYLVARGIAPSRMIHEGFGESRPIADNRYKEGRDKNRRVEFDLYLD